MKSKKPKKRILTAEASISLSWNCPHCGCVISGKLSDFNPMQLCLGGVKKQPYKVIMPKELRKL